MECSFAFLLGRFECRGLGVDHHFQHIGVKLAAVQHQYHTCADQHEKPWVDKPGQGCHTEVIGTQPLVELVGGHRDHPRGAFGEGFALLLSDMSFAHHRRRTHQYGGEVVLDRKSTRLNSNHTSISYSV